MNALGRHILVEYFGCPTDILNDVPFIESSMVAAAKEADATVINATFHHFSPFGVSGVVVIQESHLAIHTWPEYGYAAVDLFTCGETVDPWICYRSLLKSFQAGSGSSIEMLRGQMGLIPGTQAALEADREAHAPAMPSVAEGASREAPEPRYERNIWFTERSDNLAHSFRHTGQPLYKEQSEHQLVEVYDTYAWGKALTLDRLVMTTQKDEYVYHEMITQVGLFSHAAVKRALVIGGGDGGAVRDLLRHPGIEEVVMVEIDGKVVEACKAHLPEIAASFDDPRLTLHIDDGIAYVREAASASFDLVIVDSTDPVGPGEGCLPKPSTATCTASSARAAFRSPKARDRIMRRKSCRKCTPVSGASTVTIMCIATWPHIPTYPTGMWSFSWAGKAREDGSHPHPYADIDAARIDAFVAEQGLRYYNAEIHRGAFALPGFVRALVQAEQAAV